jgi:hypothetical protein
VPITSLWLFVDSPTFLADPEVVFLEDRNEGVGVFGYTESDIFFDVEFFEAFDVGGILEEGYHVAFALIIEVLGHEGGIALGLDVVFSGFNEGSGEEGVFEVYFSFPAGAEHENVVGAAENMVGHGGEVEEGADDDLAGALGAGYGLGAVGGGEGYFLTAEFFIHVFEGGIAEVEAVYFFAVAFAGGEVSLRFHGAAIFKAGERGDGGNAVGEGGGHAGGSPQDIDDDDCAVGDGILMHEVGGQTDVDGLHEVKYEYRTRNTPDSYRGTPKLNAGMLPMLGMKQNIEY